MKKLIYILIFLTGHSVNAQTYPVQAFVQITPPYTSYLPDYGNPMNNQMRVILTMLDFAEPSHNVKIRLSFEGPGWSATNEDLIPLPSFTLSPGIPLEISGSDLAPHLSSSNLVFSGIDVADYEERKVLPEGPVTVCAEVIDYSNPNQAILSNESCTQAWFSLNDPPLLNTPFCGTEIEPIDPQAIFFSWTPLGMASPYSVFGTEYTFELFEIRPDGADPNQVVHNTLPIYIETTSNTFVNYGLVHPQLQIGMSYVWRVQAKDVEGRDSYRNNGYSAVCTFTYGSIAGSLMDGIELELEAQGTGVRQGLCWWNGSAIFEEYQLEVRKTGGDYEWFPYSATEFTKKVNSLEPETEYEARVKGILGDEESEWSNIATFTTQPQPNYECGSTAQPAVVPAVVPLTFATTGYVFTIGQFDLVVSSIEPLPTTGHYKGFGRISVPFALINMKVRFDDILVDENHFVRSGSVVALTKGMDAWIDELTDIPFNVPGKIDGWEFNGDSSVTIFFGDEEVTYDFPESGSIRVEDESGLIYTFNSDGTYSVEGGITVSEDQLDAREDHQVVFLPAVEQVYGFDSKEYLQWQEDYEAIQLSDGSYYFTPYKSLGTETDYVIARIETDSLMGELSFTATQAGSISSEKINDSDYKLTLSGFSQSCYIYAFDGPAKVGKLFVKYYDEIGKELVLVPVNGASVSDLTTELNSIYRQANIKWTVEIAEGFDDSSWDLNTDGKLESADATLMSKYSSEMRALRNAYFDSHPQSDKYYVFIVPEFKDPSMDGYMVRGRAAGFLSSNPSATELAHELGHGAFDLAHTFPQIDKSTTDNLMDYSGENHLRQRQWYDIRNNLPTFTFMDDEEDGSYSTSADNILEFYNGEKIYTSISDEYAYALIDGTILKIPGVTSAMFDKYGRIYKFKAGGSIYQPKFLQVDSWISYEGYFTQESIDILKSLGSDAEWMEKKRDEALDLRFEGFADATTSDSVYVLGVRKIGDVYDDCQCIATWKNEVLNSADTYLNSPKYGAFSLQDFNRPIDYGSDINYRACSGSCPDYSEYDVAGPAENLFYELAGECPPESLDEFAHLITVLNVKAEDKTFAFYASVEDHLGNDYFLSLPMEEISPKSKVIGFFGHYEIFDGDVFHEYFGEYTEGGRTCDLVFSPVDFWTDIPDGYNSNSTDEVAKKYDGITKPYEYSLKDLIYRDRYREKGGFIYTGIQKSENAGAATAIYLNDGYDQYVAKWGTNSAFFSLLESYTETLGPVFLCYGGYQIAGMFGTVTVRPLLSRIEPILQSYISVRSREAIITAIKSYLAYLVIDASLRLATEMSPDWETAVSDVDQSAAIVQGLVDGTATYVSIPDLDLTIFKAIGACLVGIEEGAEAGDATNQCLFNALVSVIVSSGGNIVKILIQRIKALSSGAKALLKSKLLGKSDEIPEDHWVWDKVGLDNTVVQSADEISDLLETDPNTAFFWSGNSNGIGGADRALEIAQQYDGTTLEGLIESKNINMPEWDFSNPGSIKIWEDVSASYAEQVSGEIRAVVGKNLRENNVWENVELDILKNNEAVTKITVIDPETLVETVIFER